MPGPGERSEAHAWPWREVRGTCLSLERGPRHMSVAGERSEAHVCRWREVRGTCLALERDLRHMPGPGLRFEAFLKIVPL